ncbi:Hypothetical Protein FCC1311_105432 [Hondaea fermentalgiana]|uniref:Neurotransmitter-gated ion-channel ligand-binding domain-containing protein n=1 Tax=Hondaea fermentalgiana TaxID=2315210 RepID=A0A2R5GTZ4_9STRA|nr:Hypothetical Protein FCC1311_105432 [Hondaea fermentalgiana]|eukprot:GBG34320.1 Hypothetical Protein FCC1311_105432 [Hondaea fermentalgiana]
MPLGDEVFEEGDSEWVKFWNSRLEEPVVAEARFDFINIRDININNSTFKSKLLVYIRVNMEDLGISNSDRIPRPRNQHYLIDGSKKISQWTPWLQFLGEVSKHSEWVREKNGKLTYAYEWDGVFPLGERGAWFPFDFHELNVAITSNWDDSKFILAPWADSKLRRSVWSEECAVAALENEVTLVDSGCSRVRDEEVILVLRNRFKWNSTPRLTFGSSRGFTDLRYSQATASVLVDRRATFVQHIIYELLRPFLLAVLAPLSVLFFEDAATRLNYCVTLLVAMSLAFLRSTGDRVTFSDYYKLGMFLYAAIALVLSSFDNIIKDLNNINVQLSAWVVFLVFHALYYVAYLKYTWESRSTHKQYRTKVKTYEVVTNKLQKDVDNHFASVVAVSIQQPDSDDKDE